MCTNQLQLPKNCRKRLKLVLIKDGFEEIEHEFPFGTFRPENQGYLFRRFVTPGNFPPKRPKKSCFIYFPTGFSRKVWKWWTTKWQTISSLHGLGRKGLNQWCKGVPPWWLKMNPSSNKPQQKCATTDDPSITRIDVRKFVTDYS